MSTIEKKIYSKWYQKIENGTKKFELRLADFSSNKGDRLILKEWNPKTRQYTGKEIEKKITQVIKTKDINYWTQEEIDKYGLQIIFFD